MQVPDTHDTIVAVSTGWSPAAVGVVRLSGPRSFEWVTCVLSAAVNWPRRFPCVVETRVQMGGSEASWPARLLAFRAPRSYTGQDVVEIHTVGALPLLRHLCEVLIERGARRALPGEFTARAFLSGKMAAPQVDSVLGLLRAHDEAGLRAAARSAAGSRSPEVERLADAVADLLARIEAGTDFVDEEDVQFATPAEVCALLDAALAGIDQVRGVRERDRAARLPHVALVGLPNAGKSALFNALVGEVRAIVSPVIGTTRDVLSATVTLGGRAVVIQDCAGLDRSADALDLMARRASERTAELADLVVWVHASDAPWTEDEAAARARVAGEDVVLVLSKSDLASADESTAAASAIPVSALSGEGIDALRARLALWLDRRATGEAPDEGEVDLTRVSAALRRARELVDLRDETLTTPELVAVELREAYAGLGLLRFQTPDEAVLERIFSRFCVGK